MADAKKAIELDPSLTKAYLRKGYVSLLCNCYVSQAVFLYIYIVCL